MRKEMTILVAAALGGLLAASSTAQAKTVGYIFADINVPGSQPGSTGQNGLGMNNLGQVAGTYNDSSGDHNFLYTNGKYVTVPGAPGAVDTQIFGINDWGQMLGTAYYGNGSRDHFIDTHGKFTVIPDTISPVSINDRGDVLGFGALPLAPMVMASSTRRAFSPQLTCLAPLAPPLPPLTTSASSQERFATARDATPSSTQKASSPSSTSSTPRTSLL